MVLGLLNGYTWECVTVYFYTPSNKVREGIILTCLCFCVNVCHPFVRKISSDPLILIMQPNLVWWCIIMTRSVTQKGWVSIFKVKVTVRVQILREYLSGPPSSEPPNLPETWYVSNLVHYHDLGCHVKRLGSYLQLQGQGHSAGSNPQTISSELFVTRFGIMVHHHESECCVIILDCCSHISRSRSQWRFKSSANIKLLVRTIS